MKYLVSLLLFFAAFQGHAFTLKLADNQTSGVDVYEGGDKPVEIIYIHGKNSKPVIPPAEKLFDALSGAGYTVYTAEMPWGRNKYRGTQQTANEIIDQLVSKIKAKGKRAVLIGHSMGASYAVIYAAKFGEKLAGIVPIAFAHVPQMSEGLQNVTAESIVKAGNMVTAGEGKEKAQFSDLNKGEAYEIETTAEYYQSFYDPRVLPDASERIKSINVPTLWISAKRDRLTEIYTHDQLFRAIPKNEKSRQEYVKGKHVSVLKFSGESIINWLDDL